MYILQIEVGSEYPDGFFIAFQANSGIMAEIRL
jgi:hypothetical protein